MIWLHVIVFTNSGMVLHLDKRSMDDVDFILKSQIKPSLVLPLHQSWCSLLELKLGFVNVFLSFSCWYSPLLRHDLVQFSQQLRGVQVSV